MKSLSIFLVKQPIFISRFFPPSEKIVQLRNHFFSRFLSFIELKTEKSYLFFLEAFFRFSAKSKRQKIPVTIPKGFSNASLFSPPLPKFFTPIPQVSGEQSLQTYQTLPFGRKPLAARFRVHLIHLFRFILTSFLYSLVALQGYIK